MRSLSLIKITLSTLIYKIMNTDNTYETRFKPVAKIRERETDNPSKNLRRELASLEKKRMLIISYKY